MEITYRISSLEELRVITEVAESRLVHILRTYDPSSSYHLRDRCPPLYIRVSPDFIGHQSVNKDGTWPTTTFKQRYDNAYPIDALINPHLYPEILI